MGVRTLATAAQLGGLGSSSSGLPSLTGVALFLAFLNPLQTGSIAKSIAISLPTDKRENPVTSHKVPEGLRQPGTMVAEAKLTLPCAAAQGPKEQ